eukprot:GFUD01015649.1.p1 GENE.GFUD01015649.1~~GFUD01015649.1.p1  ORF type:complete len:427 (-),score=134.30 GFUD01015649.1:141-1337(-)
MDAHTSYPSSASCDRDKGTKLPAEELNAEESDRELYEENVDNDTQNDLSLPDETLQGTTIESSHLPVNAEESNTEVNKDCMDNDQNDSTIPDETVTPPAIPFTPLPDNQSQAVDSYQVEEGINHTDDSQAVTSEPKESVPLNLGARPKTSQSHLPVGSGGGGSQEVILLKQASWGSRMKPREKKPVEENFARNRKLWEKRASRTVSVISSDEEDDIEEEVRNASREMRTGTQRMDIAEEMLTHATEKRIDGVQEENTPEQQFGTIQQTPDLVLDLPTGALAESPPITLHQLSRSSRSPSSESLTSSSSESATVSISVADTFASESDTLKKIHTANTTIPPAPPESQVIPIRSTRPKTPQPAAQYQDAQGRMSTSSTFRPVGKVKLVRQVKPDDNTEQE